MTQNLISAACQGIRGGWSLVVQSGVDRQIISHNVPDNRSRHIHNSFTATPRRNPVPAMAKSVRHALEAQVQMWKVADTFDDVGSGIGEEDVGETSSVWSNHHDGGFEQSHRVVERWSRIVDEHGKGQVEVDRCRLDHLLYLVLLREPPRTGSPDENHSIPILEGEVLRDVFAEMPVI